MSTIFFPKNLDKKSFLIYKHDYNSVSYLSNDRLEGGSTNPEVITGGLQHIHNGLYGRFQGSSANAADYWHIEVYGSHRKQTNKSNATIELSR